MKIFIYGAGVVGSLYAALLSRSGEDVTILARGTRLQNIQNHGIMLVDYAHNHILTTNVKVTDRLDYDESFDLVIIAVRKNQLNEVLPSLANNKGCKNILFMLNNPSGSQPLTEVVGRERVILGFPGSGGKIGRLIVRYHILNRHLQPTMLGELDGSISLRVKGIAEIFEKAGFPTKIITNMEAWLVTHTALITPLANAINMADGNPYRLAKTRDALVLLVRAVRENFEVLDRLKVPVTPGRLRLVHFIPEPLLIGLLQVVLPSQKVEEYFTSLASSSREEMAALSSEFYQLVQKSKSSTPSAVLLCAYLDSATPPLPSSSRQIPLQWRGTALLTIASGIMLAALAWLRMGERDKT